MAGDSYALEEVSALLGVPVSDLIRRIEEGAFPGRFLTADWEMRIPVQDVRRAVDAMRRGRGTSRVSDRPQAVERALAAYGRAAGQAFQITDDWLDYSGHGESLGKNLGDDLGEGKVTLPLILALQSADAADRAFLVETIRAGGTQELERVRSILDQTGALDESQARATQFSQQACDSLSALPASPERDSLELLARFAVDRSL